jgi:hypothetical protein
MREWKLVKTRLRFIGGSLPTGRGGGQLEIGGRASRGNEGTERHVTPRNLGNVKISKTLAEVKLKILGDV